MNLLPEKFHFLEVKPAAKTVLSLKEKIFQHKFNGTAAEIFIGYESEKCVRIFGRGVFDRGILSEYTKRLPEIIKALIDLEIPDKTDFVAEIIVIDKNTGFESLELIQTRIQRGNNISIHSKINPAQLIILDVVEIEGKDIRKLKYFERLNALKNSVKNWANDYISFVNSSQSFNWDYIEENKLEGIVIRDPNTEYGKGIWKLKRETTEDVFCKGEYNKSDSMIGLFASLICYQLDKKGKEIYVADVGGGFSEIERKDIQKLLNSDKMKDHPLVIEIKTHGRTASGKFRSPIFKRIRFDKSWSQCYIN